MRQLCTWLLIFVVIAMTANVRGQLREVTAPTVEEIERLSLDPFYKKYLSYKGFPIVASAEVSDFALKEAAFLIEKMLANQPEVIAALVENRVRLAIMAPDEFTTDLPEHATLKPKAYWDKRARGLGASQERPAVSVGEENLLGYDGDPYSTESIFIHEFAHAIHLMGLNFVDSEFQERLEQAYNRASIAGLWRGKYAGTNPAEYWAEGVQSWFDTNRENDFEHNHVNTREELRLHDSELASLIESVFGDEEWRFKFPADRVEESSHLAGYDPAKAPTFVWPEELVKAFQKLEGNEDRELLTLQAMSDFVSKDATTRSGPSVQLRFDNQSDQRLTVYWVGFDGIRRKYNSLDPGRSYDQGTYGDHLWVIVDEKGQDFGWLRASKSDARVELK